MSRAVDVSGSGGSVQFLMMKSAQLAQESRGSMRDEAKDAFEDRIRAQELAVQERFDQRQQQLESKEGSAWFSVGISLLSAAATVVGAGAQNAASAVAQAGELATEAMKLTADLGRVGQIACELAKAGASAAQGYVGIAENAKAAELERSAGLIDVEVEKARNREDNAKAAADEEQRRANERLEAARSMQRRG